jgi:hypothetical protein
MHPRFQRSGEIRYYNRFAQKERGITPLTVINERAEAAERFTAYSTFGLQLLAKAEEQGIDVSRELKQILEISNYLAPPPAVPAHKAHQPYK